MGDGDAVSIDRMAPDDVDAVTDIVASAFPESGVTREERASRLLEELSRPWARVWLARAGGRIVAYVIVWIVADEVHVQSVATIAAERRHGHARRLLRHVLDAAKGGTARLVLLEVRRSNAGAIALYRSFGFAVFGLRRRYYPDDEDAIEMSVALDAKTGEPMPRADELVLH